MKPNATIVLASALIVIGVIGGIFGALNLIAEGTAADLERRGFHYDIANWPLFLVGVALVVIGLIILTTALVRRTSRKKVA